MLVISEPASAYVATSGGFTSGADAAVLTFDPFTTEVVGPNLRLLTNSTVTSASVVVEGKNGFLNTTFREDSTNDFANNSLSQGISISGGTLALAKRRSNITMDAANSFGGAVFNSTAVIGGLLRTNASTEGFFVTDNLTVPDAGWGNLFVIGDTSQGGSMNFSMLLPNGSVLVSLVPVGAVIDVDPIVHPKLRLRGSLSAPDPSASPTVSAILIGQVAGDTLLDGAVQRSLDHVQDRGGYLSLAWSDVSFQRGPGNPLLATQSGTYRSTWVVDASFVEVNGTWHAFAAVNSGNYIAGMSIAHAVSTNFTGWVWDTSPILERNMLSWDSTAVSSPQVVVNPNGSPKYFLYYSGWSSTIVRSGVAFSDDLFNWTKYSGNPVLSFTIGAWDSAGAGNPRVVYENNSWRMWYAGRSATTGGGHSMGLATSSDGLNWTKSSYNPVLPRNQTGGSIDRNDLQLKAIRKMGGVYRALFACLPAGGPYSACLAESTDGLSWTLWPGYVMNGTQNSTWDATDVQPTDLIELDGRPNLIYQGCTSGCATQQVGRAPADLAVGTITGVLDFQDRHPATLLSVVAQGTFPPDSNVTTGLRSSADGMAWSSYETIASSGTVISTAAARFVEWRVSMETSGTLSPKLTGIRLDYESFVPQGDYVSSRFSAPENVSSASVSIIPGPPSGTHVYLKLSNNNGTTWMSVSNDTAIQMSTVGSQLLYALHFEGTSGASPVIDQVLLVIQRRGLAENVTVRLGSTGTSFLSVSGVFVGAYNVSLNASDLNAIIASTLESFPTANSVDVPFVVTSTHYGQVEIREPRVTMILKNPLSVTYSPPAAAVTVDENTTTVFGATHTVFPPGTKVNTTWTLDGNVLVGQTDRTSYGLTTNFTSAGNYVLRVDVENGDFAFNHTWLVYVRNVNRSPVFSFLSPVDPVSMSHAATENFTALATDMDGESLTWQWRLDGIVLGVGLWWANVSNPPVGLHRLVVTVSDLYDSVDYGWSITSRNVLPQIEAISPSTPFTMSHMATQAVAVTATDGDGEPLTYTWFLDGFPYGGNSSSTAVVGPSPGVHSLTVTVSDFYGGASASWTITSMNTVPEIVSRSPSADFVLSHAASRVVAVAVVDADGDALTFVWDLNGVAVGNASTSQTTVDHLPVGAHTLTLHVLDAHGSNATSWAILSTNEAPVLSSALPPNPVSASHTASVNFAAAFTDGDGDALALRWMVDGTEVANGTSSFTLATVGSGAHVVEVQSSDGFATTRYSWNVTGTNGVPVVVSFGPTQNATISVSEAIELSVVVQDPDGDDVTYSWRVGTLPLASTAPSVTIGPLSEGPHDVVATASDGMSSSIFVFHITAANFAPEILGSDPATDFEMAYTAERVVSLNVTDREGDALTYQWSLGSRVLSSRGPSTTIGPLQEGSYSLRALVRDRDSQAERTWTVTVRNDAPKFLDVQPATGNVSVEALSDIVFSARAADPDGDTVVLQWAVDNEPQNMRGPLTLRWMVAGRHTVSLDAVSPGHIVSARWNVTVTQVNVAPAIGGAAPADPEVEMATGAEGVFAVQVDDDGVLPLTVTWFVDGVANGTGTGFAYRPTGLDVGRHEVLVRVSDGQYQAERKWSVTVFEPSQGTGNGGLGDLLPFVVGVVGGAVATAALFLALRRRGQRGPEGYWEPIDGGPPRRR